MRFQSLTRFAVAGVLAAAVAAPAAMLAQGGGAILKPVDTEKLLPSHVYYKAQSAPTQLRNSTGVKFSDGYYVLATLVDTSGYSSDVASKYQAYFIIEVPIKIGDQSLPAGVYGIGFLPGNKFVVTDVGAHDVFTATSTNDADLKRPMPLQIIADPAGGYRLYAGRNYVAFSR